MGSCRGDHLDAWEGRVNETKNGVVRLAKALSALYPWNSEEKRLLDGMLLAVPR